MKRVGLGLLALWVVFCLAAESRAVDRIRVDSIEPSVVDPGGEFTLRGADLLCSGRSYSSQTRVLMQWRNGGALHWRHLQLSVILDNEIKAHVPRDVAPGEYTIYVVNHSRSRQLQCRSNPVVLTVRQPAPPAVAADPTQVMSNPCSRHTPADTAADLAFSLPGTAESSPPSCRYPMKLIQLIPDSRTAIYPSAPIYISGITLQDQNMVLAILRAERVSVGPDRYRYSVVRLLKVEVRTRALTMARIPYELDSGTYKIAALYRFVRDRSLRDLREDPFGSGRAARPLFVMGSNVIDLEVTGPTHR